MILVQVRADQLLKISLLLYRKGSWIKKIDPELIWLGFETKNTPGLINPTVDEAMIFYNDFL